MTNTVTREPVAVLESRTGRVEVLETETGFVIVGGSRIWWEADGETPWGRFTAEIPRCDHFEGVLTKDWPVCTNMHNGRNCSRKCHELGHLERAVKFAEKVLRSY